jgi:hypothetical protein
VTAPLPAVEALVERVSKAQADVLAAEAALETAIRAIEVLPRADKTSVSAAVSEAFQKVREVRAELRELESIVLSSSKSEPR